MVEWVGKNLKNQDRAGYFVMLAQVNGNLEKIKLMGSEGGHVLGVVSAASVVLGDNGCHWHDMYVKDQYGRMVYKWVEINYSQSFYNEKSRELGILSQSIYKYFKY